MSFPQVLVLVAAMNEKEGIGYTLDEVKKVLGNPALFVVDGNSTDGTVNIARSMGAKVLIQKGKGKGNAIREAIANVDVDVEYVVITDADFTYPSEYLPEMIKILKNNRHVGMVCGNRFTDELNLGGMHDILYFGNRLLALTHNLLNGVKLKDPLTGMRVVRWDVMKGWKPKSKGFDIEVELNHQVERKGYTIVEMPIEYRVRLGEKKLKLKHGLTILKRILTESLS
jgi:glycosyltransferase involved in cell wall biosynthesis